MILTIIVGILFGFSLAALIWAFSDEDVAPLRRPAGIATFVFLVLTILSTGFRIIPAGNVGVVTRFGEVQDRILHPGLQFVMPVAEGIVEVTTRVRGVGFENLGAASSEYQDVFLTGTLNIHVEAEGAGDLFQRVGLDYVDKLVNPFFAQIVKEIVPQYDIDEILIKREEIRRLTVESLNEKLNPYNIVVDDVALAQISFSEAYTTAIEDKQVQEQRVLTERQILEQRRTQAEQNVVTAQGEADAAVARAEGEAEANRLLTESLSDILVQYVAIQQLNDNIEVILLPSDNGFILNLENLTQQAEEDQP